MRFRAASSRRQSAGFTLMEIMMGLSIGTIVIAAGALVFSSSQVSSTAVAELAAMDESSRTIENLIQKAISSAGFFGCQSRGGILQNNIAGGSASYLYNFAQPLYGYQSSGSAWSGAGGATSLDASLSGANPSPPVSLRSDVLAIRAANGPTIRLDSGSAAPGATGDIYAAPNGFIGTAIAKAAVLITNCSRSTAFINTAGSDCTTAAVCAVQHAAAAGAGPGNASGTGSLGFNFGYDAELLTPATTSIFVANSQRCIAGAAGGACPSYSLYRMVGTSAPEEIATNVSGMQVTYYADTGGGLSSGNQSYTAANVPNFNQVVAIKADFLITSSRAILPNSQAYPAPYSGWLSADKLAKRVFSIKVNLRNAQS